MLRKYLDYLQAKQIHPLLPAYNAIFVLELALFQMYTTLFLTFFFSLGTWKPQQPDLNIIITYSKLMLQICSFEHFGG